MSIIEEFTTLVHNFGRIIMSIVGLFFILFGLVVFGASWYEIITYPFNEGELIILFIKIAEYYLISITFVSVGRSIISLSKHVELPVDIRTLEKYLFSLIISISSVAFISLILETTGLNISILYVGLAIASVAVALGVYLYLSRDELLKPPYPREKKEEEEKKEEVEKTSGEEKMREQPKKEEEDK